MMLPCCWWKPVPCFFPKMKIDEAKKILEAVLLCAQQPLPLHDLVRLFVDTDDLFVRQKETVSSSMTERRCRQLLYDLQYDWSDRGLELVSLPDGWRFQSRSEMKPYFDRLRQEKPLRYSRATMEILAVIAYSQPVTRGDIEQIRGVAVNAQSIRTLEERGWIEVIGHREAPGRPALFATTSQFLDDLGLQSLKELPPLEELREADLMQPELDLDQKTE